MFNYDILRDQNRLQAQIGLELPPSEIIKRFFTYGEARVDRPMPSYEPGFKELKVPLIASPGDDVPVVYMRSGYVRFAVARWGYPNPAYTESTENYRHARGYRIGHPGLIPVTFIDMAAKTEDGGWDIKRSGHPDFLKFIACSFMPNSAGDAAYVMPLVRGVLAHTKSHCDWEMLAVGIQEKPQQGNYDFIQGKYHRELQVP